MKKRHSVKENEMCVWSKQCNEFDNNNSKIRHIFFLINCWSSVVATVVQSPLSKSSLTKIFNPFIFHYTEKRS